MKAASKFDELRSKTDRDLVQLLQKELDSGLAAAFEGLTGKARDAYQRTSRLVRAVPENDAELVVLNMRLARLRRVLNCRERAAMPQSESAMCFSC